MQFVSKKCLDHLALSLSDTALKKIDVMIRNLNERVPGFSACVYETQMLMNEVPSFVAFDNSTFNIMPKIRLYDIEVAAPLAKKKSHLKRDCTEFVVKSSPTSTTCHLVIGYGNKETYIIPLAYVLKEAEDLVLNPGSYQIYEHNLINSDYDMHSNVYDYMYLHKKYIGLTSRPWQVRYREHEYAANRGSHLLFHRALAMRLPGFKYKKQEHVLMRAGISKQKAFELEEAEIEDRSFVDKHPDNGLNMIPGGYAGFEYIKTLGINSKIDISEVSNVTDTEIERIIERILKKSNKLPITYKEWSESVNCDSRSLDYNQSRDKDNEDRYLRLKEFWHRLSSAGLINSKDIDQYRELVVDYNKSLMSGYQTTPPALISPVFSQNVDLTSLSNQWRILCAYVDSVLQSNENKNLYYRLVSKEEDFYGGDTALTFEHKDCGTQSYIFCSTLKDKGLDLRGLCRKRDCYEYQTGVKLQDNSYVPSQEGMVPSNKRDIADIQIEIDNLSNGTLKLDRKTYTDVVKPFYVQVTKKGNQTKMTGLHIRVGGHDNAVRKKVYQNHEKRIKNGGKFHSRTEVLTDIEFKNLFD